MKNLIRNLGRASKEKPIGFNVIFRMDMPQDNPQVPLSKSIAVRVMRYGTMHGKKADAKKYRDQFAPMGEVVPVYA